MKAKIENIGVNFEGVTHLDGKVVFCDKVLTNEIVDIEIVKEKKDFSFAKVNNILSKSENRIAPICEHYNSCGGCDCLHINDSFELEAKKEIVKKTLKKIANIDVSNIDAVQSEKTLNFRNKISFFVKDGKIGLKEKNSNNLVEVDCCHLANEKINKTLTAIKESVNFVNSSCKNIVIRTIEEKTLVVFVFNDKKDLNIESFLSKLNENDFGVYFNFNPNQNEILSENFEHVFGLKRINTKLFGINFEIDPYSFFQTNTDICKKLYSFIFNNILSDYVLDCYSGSCILGAMIANKVKAVECIEINPESILNAKQLFKRNSLKNININHGKVEDLIDSTAKKFCHNKFTVVLDPPKAGCNRRVLETILRVKPQEVIYVSCSPQTLSRDLSYLKNHYQVKQVQIFNMFPQTKHIETVCILNSI